MTTGKNIQTHRQHRHLLTLLVALYALAAVVYTVLPGGLLASVQTFSDASLPDMPLWQMALGNALIILLW